MSFIAHKDVRTILGQLVLTHWGKRIVAAEKRGRFVKRDIEDAGNWPTCACGKVYIRKRFRVSGSKERIPMDDKLGVMGDQFVDHVNGHNFIWAAILLRDIEDRAAKGV